MNALKTKVKENKILIVDDDADMQVFLATLLEAGGFKTIITSNGSDGMQKIIEENPTLIILDVPMQGKKGIQMYLNLKQNEDLKSIPVIMISTLEQQTILQYRKSIKTSYNQNIGEPEAYLRKPVEAEDLIAKVLEIFEPPKRKESTMKIV
jgi:CheY-like chemotaxis protein